MLRKETEDDVEEDGEYHSLLKENDDLKVCIITVTQACCFIP